MALDPQLKILLVEDAATMRKMEVRILGQIGFGNIIEAVNGKEALEKLATNPDVKVVISDWSMPEMDGYALLLHLRGSADRAGLPFIMATGQGDKEHVAQAMDAGANAVVAKPFSPDELKTRINEIFGVVTAPTAAAPVKRETADGKVLLKAAHIQITDHLALGVLKHQINHGLVAPHTFGLETRCMPNWNMVQASLEKGEVDAAFILAPAAMDLYNYKVPIRLVLFAHRDGSIMVRNKVGDYRKPYQQFFKHKTFFVPYKMSIHNMLAHKYFSDMGLRPGVAGNEAVNVLFDVVAPVNMPEFLAENPNACGFMVAEPIGSRAISAGIAEKQVLSSEIWGNHPCCVVVFRDEFIQRYTDTVHEFTQMLVQAGQFIKNDPAASAGIAVDFLDPQKKIGLSADLLKNVLTDPQGIHTDELYPSLEDLDVIQRYMKEKMGIGAIIELEKFADLRFADEAMKGLRKKQAEAGEVLEVTEVRKKKTSSFGLLKETVGKGVHAGKYMIFQLAGEQYGIPVLDVREIIQMMPIVAIPRLPSFVKGIINLRSRVIPVIDLREKFGMDSIPYTERMCIVIAEIAGKGGSALMGVIVDAVQEVIDIAEGIMQETPSFGAHLNTSFIIGIARTPGRITILMDVEIVLTQHELMALTAMAPGATA